LGPITAFSSGAVALDSLDRLDGLNVVVVCGTGQEQLKKATGAIAAFTARGGKLVVLGRPADGPLSWSPVPITAKTVKGVRSLVKHNPAMPAWISNADLYFRTERPASAFSAQGATFLDDRETIASIPAGQGRIYLLGYEPADFTPVPIELGKAYYRTTKVPTYFDTLEPDGLLQGTSYTSFIDQLVALKPIRLVHCILDDLGVFNSQPLFTSTTRQNGKVGDEPFSIEVTDWKFRLDPENIGLKSGWQRGEGQGWADIKLSLAWEKQGYTQPNPHYLIAPNGKRDDAGQYNGFAWYGAQVNVPASAKEAGPLHLEIEGVDDFDTTYINGNPVGHTGNETPNAPAVARHYNLRADSLFFGARNTITIQVEDVYAEGMVKGPVRIVASRKNDAKAALPYPANYPILDLNAFHNW